MSGQVIDLAEARKKKPDIRSAWTQHLKYLLGLSFAERGARNAEARRRAANKSLGEFTRQTKGRAK